TNESFLFTLDWEEAGKPKSAGMVLRAEGKTYPVYPDSKIRKQFLILQRLEGAGVPAPRPYWYESDESLLGTPFYIMGRINGSVPSEFPPYHSFGLCYDATPEKRARMWWSTLEAVAGLHKLDWRKLDFSFLGIPPSGTGPLDQVLAYWEKYFEWTKESPDESHPTFEAARDWLRANRYAPEHVSVCWGDARLPNAIYSPDGEVLGLLDWDAAHLGDPESDLAFILTLDHLLGEGTGVPRLPGFPNKEETVRRYEELTGRKVKHLFYNEVLAAYTSGLTILKVQKNLKKIGIVLPGDDPERDNFSTRYLAGLLGLAMPGAATAEVRRIEDVMAVVQFRLTGPSGRDWYLVSDKGKVTRHNGVAPNPDATVTASAEDWAAIQRGELKRFHAWTSGKLTITGNNSLVQQLEDTIGKLGE
ncbi:MAG: hypothetical protein FJZ95_08395, partial [Chloroflexi bacterium]|nr:hypothetical protein [Chloroflexota bacterium]